jgi:hypothetical protein
MRLAMILTAQLVLLVCSAACDPSPASDGVTVRGTAVAGPTCPVERDPPDPACAERPVIGADVVVVAADSGAEVARLTTDEAGSFSVTLPLGRYRIVAQPVPGLMAEPAPIDVELVDGEVPEPVVLAYDTGIR